MPTRGHRRRGRTALAVIALAGVAYAGSAAMGEMQPGGAWDGGRDRAGGPGARVEPDVPRRVVRSFDFEEPENPDPVPSHWFRAQDDPPNRARPGFPTFNRSEFAIGTAHGGNASVYLPTRGGSTSLRLSAGEVPVFPMADYAVMAFVRTTELEHARAVVTARLLDQALAPIAGSEVKSEPVLSPGGWTPVRVEIPGSDARAAYLQVDLEVLQPRQLAGGPSGALAEHTVWREDIEGGAWFDDVTVMLVPRTRLSVSPGSLLVQPASPVLKVQARDQGGDPLLARLQIVDVDGREVDRGELSVDPSGRPTSWTPRLPGPGWYRCVQSVEAQGAILNRTETWIGVLPKAMELTGAATLDLERFGIIAEDVSEGLLKDVPGLVRSAGSRFVLVQAIDASAPVSGARAALSARREALDGLLATGQEIVLSLATVPGELAARHSIDVRDWGTLCGLDAGIWAGCLDPTFDVYGQRITTYQLGATAPTVNLAQATPEAVKALRSAASHLVPDPRIGVPMRADREFPSGPKGPGRADFVTVTLPAGFPADAIEQLTPRIEGALKAGIGVTISPELLDMEKFGARARVDDAARRLVEFWRTLDSSATIASTGEGETGGVGKGEMKDEAGKRPIARWALTSPLQARSDGSAPRLAPMPELPATAHMIRRLAGRRFVREVFAPDGVRAFLLAEKSGLKLTRACVVAYADAAPDDRAYVDVAPLGGALEVVDVFGTESTLPAGESTAALRRVRLTDSPVFIENVDPYVTLFMASLRVEPRSLPSVVAEHEGRLVLTNPWPVRITGQVQIKNPPAEDDRRSGSSPWQFTPDLTDFSMGPGETLSLPVTMTFGPGQLAGTKTLVVVAKVLAERQVPALKIDSTIEIGLPDLELVPDAQVSASGKDVVVTATVTNRGDRPRTLRVELVARDTPSQQLAISDLPAGQTVVQRFVLKDAAGRLRGRRVLVSLSDTESASRLSKAAMVP